VDGLVDEVIGHVPTEIKIAVTSSPTRGIDATLQVCEALARRGFPVAPHLAARAVRDERHLQDILERLDAIGVRDAFIVAGDLSEPAGRFAGAGALLAAMAELGHGLADIGISGYPESHPFLSDETTIQAMFDKEPFATYIVSQLCLDARVSTWWIGAVRARGVRLPIHIGIAGPIGSRKLLRIATRIGVGESVRFVRGRGSLLTGLFLRGRYGPGSLIEELAPELENPASAVYGLHVYTFNELAATERWRLAALRRLES
jgi:methylenetetrahydrofolate reductase (NADPH)